MVQTTGTLVLEPPAQNPSIRLLRILWWPDEHLVSINILRFGNAATKSGQGSKELPGDSCRLHLFLCVGFLFTVRFPVIFYMCFTCVPSPLPPLCIKSWCSQSSVSVSLFSLVNLVCWSVLSVVSPPWRTPCGNPELDIAFVCLQDCKSVFLFWIIEQRYFCRLNLGPAPALP